MNEEAGRENLLRGRVSFTSVQACQAPVYRGVVEFASVPASVQACHQAYWATNARGSKCFARRGGPAELVLTSRQAVRRGTSKASKVAYIYTSHPNLPSIRQRHRKMGVFFEIIRQRTVSEAAGVRQRVQSPGPKVRSQPLLLWSAKGSNLEAARRRMEAQTTSGCGWIGPDQGS
jgi:hypothetical protein